MKRQTVWGLCFWVAILSLGLTACNSGGGGNINTPPPEITLGGDSAGIVGLSGDTIGRSVPQGGPNPANQMVTLTNGGNCTLAYTVTKVTVDGAAWFSVAPASGTVTASSSAPLTISFDVIGPPALNPGTYTGTITVAGTCAANSQPASGSPVVIAVNLRVTPSAPQSATISANTAVITEDIAVLSDQWSPTTTTGAPAARAYHTAVWTGSKMIVWGGSGVDGYRNTGGLYNPVTDSWATTTIIGAPSGRYGNTAIWTGSKMVVWGGSSSAGFLNDGGIYDPVTDSWATTTIIGAPSGRYGHTAVWTGSKMIVFGGVGIVNNVVSELNTGGVYDPVTNSWTAMTTTSVPLGRQYHTAVWTGSQMIVWGGYNRVSLMNGNGGLYDPGTNSWTVMTTLGVPISRQLHTAVWTGSQMIVWGGSIGDPFSGATIQQGDIYNLVSNSWTSFGTPTGIPSGRRYHTAIWTGSKMIVWGGIGGNNLNDGGIYDPVINRWTTITIAGTPSGRGYHTAVWTGSKMIVWGGMQSGGVLGQLFLDTGGVYE